MRGRWQFKVVCTSFFLCTFFSLHATNYFVFSNGNDKNSGLKTSEAWQSIDKINNSTFKPGDTIYLNGSDTFYGSIFLPSTVAGTKGAPVVLSGWGKGKATIMSGSSSGFTSYNASYVEIKQLIFIGNGYNNNSVIGVNFYMDLTNNQHLSGIKIEDVEVSGYHTTGISIGSWPSDGSRSGYDDVTINNCLAFANGHSGISSFGYYSTSDTLYSHHNFKITNCIVHHNDGISGHTTHSGNGIVIGQVDECIIERCEAYENGKNNTFAAAGPAGIWAWDSKHVTIQYCYSHHNRTQTLDGDGFDLDGGVQESVMQYNYAHDNEGPGFLIAQYTGARNMKNNVVRYNISERDGNGLGMLVWSGDAANSGTAEGIDIYNNVVYVDTIGNSWVNAAFSFINNYGAIKDIRVANNIFVTKNKVPMIDVAKAINLKFYNNVYYSYGGNAQFKYDNSSYSSLFLWRNATGQEIYGGKSVGYTSNPNLLKIGEQGNIKDAYDLENIHSYRLSFPNFLINKGIYIDSLLGMDSLKTDFFGNRIDVKNQFTPGVHEMIVPVASFSKQDVCMGDSMQFMNSSLNGLRYKWDFGDGDTSSEINPKHLYIAAGNYRVQLSVFQKYEVVDTQVRYVLVAAKPKASFTISNACEQDSINLQDASQNFTSSIWIWQDVDTLIVENGKFWKDTLGTFKVHLAIRNFGLCEDTLTKYYAQNRKPLTDFEVGDVCFGESIEVKTKINANDTAFITFGDGRMDSTYRETYVHQYADAGWFAIKLMVKTTNNCMDSNEKEVRVFPRPQAKFESLPFCFGDSARFVLNNLNFTTVLWSVNDVEISSHQQLKTLFSDTGNQQVTAAVQNQFQCFDTFSSTVVVKPLPNANFVFERQGDVLTFTASDTNLLSYMWTASDTSAESKNFRFEYAPPDFGEFSIILQVSDTNLCVGKTTKTIDFKNLSNTEHHPDLHEINVFPNPFTDRLYLSLHLPKSSNCELNIYDAMGHILFTSEIQLLMNKRTIEIKDLANFPSGMYMLRLYSEHFSQYVRISKL